MLLYDEYAKLTKVSDELTGLLNCRDHCEERCVFSDIGTGEGCPINEFINRVEDAMEETGWEK